MFPLNEILKNNSDLSASQIEGILYLLLHEENLTNTDLINKTGLPKETLRRFKSSISFALKEPNSDKILLKQEISSVLAEKNLSPYRWSLLTYSDSSLERQLKEIRKEYALTPKREYDQFFATEATSIGKVRVMKDRGDIKGKRIALLGDDDFISVVFGLLKEDYAEITVFDIDQDILKTIDKIAKDKGFSNIKTEFYDAQKDPRQDLQGRFDVVVTDPPYTLNGIKLFLNRSLAFLGDTANKSIYLYYGNSIKNPEKTLQIQEMLAKYKLLIREKIDNFARYNGAESIGSASSLYLLQTLKNTQRPTGQKITDIYTHQKSHTGDFPYVEHYVFKLYSVPENIIESKSQLQQSIGKFCQYNRLKVVSTKITRFSGGGFTFSYILASSNLTVHTWPEFKALHLVLVTCEPIQNADKLYSTLSSLFKTEKIEIERIE